MTGPWIVFPLAESFRGRVLPLQLFPDKTYDTAGLLHTTRKFLAVFWFWHSVMGSRDNPRSLHGSTWYEHISLLTRATVLIAVTASQYQLIRDVVWCSQNVSHLYFIIMMLWSFSRLTISCHALFPTARPIIYASSARHPLLIWWTISGLQSWVLVATYI